MITERKGLIYVDSRGNEFLSLHEAARSEAEIAISEVHSKAGRAVRNRILEDLIRYPEIVLAGAAALQQNPQPEGEQ